MLGGGNKSSTSIPSSKIILYYLILVIKYKTIKVEWVLQVHNCITNNYTFDILLYELLMFNFSRTFDEINASKIINSETKEK